MSSPTQRSLKHLRKNGWTAQVVEKWLPPRGKMKFGVRIDLFGFGDIVACRPPVQVINATLPGLIAIVQCTSASGGGYAAHRAKILAAPAFPTWKAAGGRVFLQGWAKRGKRGEKKVWQLREEEL